MYDINDEIHLFELNKKNEMTTHKCISLIVHRQKQLLVNNHI